MRDIDQELKEVQLQRERLALEREIALKEATSTVRTVAKGVVQAPKTIGRVLSLWWKKILLLAVLMATIGGTLNWILEYDRQQKRAAYQAKYERWDAASGDFAILQCPAQNFQCDAAESAKNETCYSNAKDLLERYNCRYVGCMQSLWDIQRNSCLETQKSKYKQDNPLTEAP